MSEWKPLFFGVGIIIIVGVIMAFIVSPFVELETTEPEGFAGAVVDVINNGVNLTIIEGLPFDAGTFQLDFFVFFGQEVRDWFVNATLWFAEIPIIISATLLVIALIGIGYTTIRLARG